MEDEGKEEETVQQNVIFGDPGGVSGGGKSQNGREKIRAKKVKKMKKSPRRQGFNGPVQTVGEVLASNWCEKPLFCSTQSQSSKTRSCFASYYMIDTHKPIA